MNDVIAPTPTMPRSHHMGREFPLSLPESAHWSDRTVKQGHVDYCAAWGHAFYVIDDVDQGYCPRCGAVTEIAPATPRACEHDECPRTECRALPIGTPTACEHTECGFTGFCQSSPEPTPIPAPIPVRPALACVAATVLAIGVTIGAAFTPTPADALTPCPTEDSTGCYWDASERGNGIGADVVSLDGETH